MISAMDLMSRSVRKAIDIDTVDDERVAIGPLPLLAEPTVRHAEEAIRSSTSCKVC